MQRRLKGRKKYAPRPASQQHDSRRQNRQPLEDPQRKRSGVYKVFIEKARMNVLFIRALIILILFCLIALREQQ